MKSISLFSSKENKGGNPHFILKCGAPEKDYLLGLIQRRTQDFVLGEAQRKFYSHKSTRPSIFVCM